MGVHTRLDDDVGAADWKVSAVQSVTCLHTRLVRGVQGVSAYWSAAHELQRTHFVSALVLQRTSAYVPDEHVEQGVQMLTHKRRA